MTYAFYLTAGAMLVLALALLATPAKYRNNPDTYEGDNA